MKLKNKILVVSRSSKLAISYDQAKTWTVVQNGLAAPAENGAMAEGNGVIIGVAFDHSTGQGSITRSSDNGVSWSAINYGNTLGEWSLRVHFDGSEFVLFSGGNTWKSKDGLKWTVVPMKIDGVNAPSYWRAATEYNPRTKMFVGILSVYNGEGDKQKAYRSPDGINWTTVAPDKFKGGTAILAMTIGEMESKFCP